MNYVSLPDNTTRKLPFYLTMEEYLATGSAVKNCDLFFMWQVTPSVIFGRNQIINREVNIDYCNRHGIKCYRRRSGGGCVYADSSNIMFSYITAAETDVSTTFERYTSMVADMLRSLGLDASHTGRNDVLIGNRKVSGNAFYHLPGRSIVHGTMLYDTDMTHMTNAITPSKNKLDAKGVASVKSRITTLKEHLDISIDKFKEYARQYLCNGEIRLSQSEAERIEELSKPYYSPRWIMGHSTKGSVAVARHIDGCGEFEVTLDLDGGIIRSVNLGGDFFLLSDLDSMLLNRLHNVPYTKEGVEQALKGIDTSRIIHNLDTTQFINLLF